MTTIPDPDTIKEREKDAKTFVLDEMDDEKPKADPAPAPDYYYDCG